MRQVESWAHISVYDPISKRTHIDREPTELACANSRRSESYSRSILRRGLTLRVVLCLHSYLAQMIHLVNSISRAFLARSRAAELRVILSLVWYTITASCSASTERRLIRLRSTTPAFSLSVVSRP